MDECGDMVVIDGREHRCRKWWHICGGNPIHRCECNETWVRTADGGWKPSPW